MPQIRRRGSFFLNLGDQPGLDRCGSPLSLRICIGKTAGLEDDGAQFGDAAATCIVEVHKRKPRPGHRILKERDHRCRRQAMFAAQMQKSADKAVAPISIIVIAARPMVLVGKELEHEIEQPHGFCDFCFGHWVDRFRSRDNELSISSAGAIPHPRSLIENDRLEQRGIVVLDVADAAAGADDHIVAIEGEKMGARADVIVLGAGMVGVSVALHLQKRGRDVVLLDRRDPGEETSYGNAGLIQREAVFPYTFPREFGTILSYAMNHRRDAVYHLSALPRLAPWLFRYWQNATSERIQRSAQALAPLMARCVDEHNALIAEAGAAALSVVHHQGWLNCFRKEEALDQSIIDLRRLEQYGVDYAPLSKAQLRELEPHLAEAIVGAIHFRGSPTSSAPGLLTKAYAELFIRRGGRFQRGDARRLVPEPSGWSLATEMGPIDAREAVIALGPWSDDVFRPLGYDIPLAVKRGYHMHYGVRGNATLTHPIRDADGGYALAPMSKGIRLTTGVEFADRDAPPSPVQLSRDEPLARKLFPLAERLDPEPWMGRRPCLPDMVPVIGKGERHQGLWFAFGHAHHGFTLGPVTGRLLAEMMTEERPFTESSCYSASRFGNRN